jgi:hypothetical protein
MGLMAGCGLGEFDDRQRRGAAGGLVFDPIELRFYLGLAFVELIDVQHEPRFELVAGAHKPLRHFPERDPEEDCSRDRKTELGDQFGDCVNSHVGSEMSGDFEGAGMFAAEGRIVRFAQFHQVLAAQLARLDRLAAVSAALRFGRGTPAGAAFEEFGQISHVLF